MLFVHICSHFCGLEKFPEIQHPFVSPVLNGQEQRLLSGTVPAEQEPDSSLLHACVVASSCVILLLTARVVAGTALFCYYYCLAWRRAPVIPSVSTISSWCFLSSLALALCLGSHPGPHWVFLIQASGPTRLSLGCRTMGLTSQTGSHFTDGVSEGLGLLRWVKGPCGTPPPHCFPLPSRKELERDHLGNEVVFM